MILVAYASKHGATEGIARSIAERLIARGMNVHVESASDVAELGEPEAVVLGSAIYAGSWRSEAMEFVDRFEDGLSRAPVWLFSSGPLGEHVSDEEEQPKQLADLRARLSPRDHRVFFGALDKSKLSFGERMIVKAVKAPDGDYRNWDEIGAWTEGIVDSLTQ
jgi:menaquinone-dependent protoporphyrinogen oxidase